MTHKFIICCDFDGVIHSYTSGWQGDAKIILDPPVEGALEWLWLTLNDDRFELNIYSSRSKYPGGIEAMKAWLTKYYRELIAKDSPEETDYAEVIVERFTFPTEKPAASLLIDDRAYHFQGKFPTAAWMLGFKPWTKNPPVWESWIEKRIEPGQIHVRIVEDGNSKELVLTPTMAASFELVCGSDAHVTSVEVRDAEGRISELKAKNRALEEKVRALELQLDLRST